MAVDYLSICAIIKDENTYLPEWIEYHKLIGVERFYIYDNGSAIPLSQTLAPDVAKGDIIINPIHGIDKQREVYTRCYSDYGSRTVWMAFIDVDEFLFPKFTDDFRVFLKERECFSGISVNWRMFGSSGLEKRPDGLQIEHFLHRAPDEYDHNKHVKAIAKPSALSGFFPNPHYCPFLPGHYSVDSDGRRVEGPFNPPTPYHKVQLNHYFTRSHQESYEKTVRGTCEGPAKRMEFMNSVDKACTIRDEGMLRFAPALKAAINRRR